MTILSLPSGIQYQSGRWRYMSNAARFSSPITRTQQSVSRVGDFWAATLTAPPIRDRQKAAEWAALLAQLAGGVNGVYLHPPLLGVHTINGASAPKINGASQTGSTLALKGLTAGDTFRAGGFLCYDTSTFRMLHMVRTTTVAAGATASIPVAPMIRKSPADNANVNVSTPSCEMTLSESDAELFALDDALWYGVSASFIERVRE